MSSVEVPTVEVGRDFRRFAVAWRNRTTKVTKPVAVLDHVAGGYRFQYLAGVDEIDGFRPFIGFPDVRRSYESERLWPFFDLRVMDTKRPDYPAYVRQLALSPHASRLDILSRSGGQQKGDSVLLTEAPYIGADGATESMFLARGSGHLGMAQEDAAALNDLRAGTALRIIDDPANEANALALLLVTTGGVRVGWVPDLLIAYAREVRATGGSATVVQNNGPKAAWHMRLVVRIWGKAQGSALQFQGGVWPPLR